MTRRYIVYLAGVLLLGVMVTGVFAGGSTTPLVATFESTLAATGVTGDATQASYANGVGGVRCYLGVGGKNVDLITYNTARALSFTFDGTSSAFQSSGLPSASFLAPVDLYGVNFYGPYQTMGIGTTAQVQLDLEFKVAGGSLTYGLLYNTLAVKRTAVDTWFLTSNPNDIGYNPGFTASSTATLYDFRHSKKETFGTVSMPIRFQVQVQ